MCWCQVREGGTECRIVGADHVATHAHAHTVSGECCQRRVDHIFGKAIFLVMESLEGILIASWDAIGCLLLVRVNAEQRASMALNASIIEDQQKALRKVAEEVTGLNELFVELGHIVASQGEEVENVASLAHRMADDVQAARQELERAELDQQKGGCVLS